ncbi:hypothetical protein LA5094_05432 [Roseibium album]|nr:hypothetical protein LA5094_05432 [Roseibium album]
MLQNNTQVDAVALADPDNSPSCLFASLQGFLTQNMFAVGREQTNQVLARIGRRQDESGINRRIGSQSLGTLGNGEPVFTGECRPRSFTTGVNSLYVNDICQLLESTCMRFRPHAATDDRQAELFHVCTPLVMTLPLASNRCICALSKRR